MFSFMRVSYGVPVVSPMSDLYVISAIAMQYILSSYTQPLYFQCKCDYKEHIYNYYIKPASLHMKLKS